jgi:peroxiredoxin
MKVLFFTVLLSLLSPLSNATVEQSLAPDFTLKSNTGENLRLDEYRGQVVMLNFWASWCAPCRQEMPHLSELHDKYAPLGFQLLGINVDENIEDAKKALQKFSITFPVLFDQANSIAELYNVDAMPTTIIIDKDGKIRHLHRGYKSGYEKDYQDQVSALIKEF